MAKVKVLATFPLKALADVCAKEVGSSVHKATNGTYTVPLNREQLKRWDAVKREVGVK